MARCPLLETRIINGAIIRGRCREFPGYEVVFDNSRPIKHPLCPSSNSGIFCDSSTPGAIKIVLGPISEGVGLVERRWRA